MLEPLAAIGLAGSLVQFVDFCGRIIAEGYSAYQSATGVSRDNAHLEVVIRDLQGWSKKFNSVQTSPSTLSEDEKALQGLRVDCYILAGELLAILEKLRVKRTGHLRSIAALGKSIQHFHKSDKIKRLSKQLDELRSEINLRLLRIIK